MKTTLLFLVTLFLWMPAFGQVQTTDKMLKDIVGTGPTARGVDPESTAATALVDKNREVRINAYSGNIVVSPADGVTGSMRLLVTQARTATATGATTGTISATASHVTVTSADADHIVILPAPVVGKQLVIHSGATGYELRSSSPTTVAINTGTGSAAESAIAANSTLFLTCVTATAWKGFFMDADGDLAKIEVAAP